MAKEFIYMGDGSVELADQAEARFQEEMRYIRPDAPYVCRGDRVLGWIASGRSGNVTIMANADQEQEVRSASVE